MVPPLAAAGGHSGSQIHGREPRRNAMALEITGLARGDTWRYRQNRFRPNQRLHLTFFIHAQDDGPVRRIQVQAHNAYIPIAKSRSPGWCSWCGELLVVRAGGDRGLSGAD
jgi:hypothetical protein